MKYFLILLFFPVFSCESQTSLPDKRPKDFKVKLRRDGGMLPQSHTYLISDDTSGVEKWNRGDKVHFKLNFTDPELDSLYGIIKSASFDKIKIVEEEEVYDRGGISIELTAGGKDYDKDNSGLSFVKKESRDDFNKVKSAINAFVDKKLEAQERELTFVVDESLLQHKDDLYFSVYGSPVHYDERRDTIKKETTYRILPGKYILDVSLFLETEQSWNRKRSFSIDEDVNISGDHKIYLGWKDSTITFKIE